MAENERQQRLIERVQEDERLRGDLEDAAATALVEWASQRVATAAADPARPDAEVEAEVQAIRAAARSAARSGEAEPQRVIELANATLGESAKSAPQTQPSTTKPESTGDAAQPRLDTKIVLTSPEQPETAQRVLTQKVIEPSTSAPKVPAQPAKVVVEPSAPSAPAKIMVKPNAPPAPEPAQPATKPIASIPPTPPAPEQAEPAQPAKIVVKPSAPPAPEPAQPAAKPIASIPPTPPAPEPAQPAAVEPQRRRVSFWRRWSPFAGIWNRFRGDR